MPDAVESAPGKQALLYAMNSDYCVLEFRERDDGTMVVMEITEHLEQLEEMYANENETDDIGLRTGVTDGSE
jgi:hypothetical protein